VEEFHELKLTNTGKIYTVVRKVSGITHKDSKSSKSSVFVW